MSGPGEDHGPGATHEATADNCDFFHGEGYLTVGLERRIFAARWTFAGARLVHARRTTAQRLNDLVKSSVVFWTTFFSCRDSAINCVSFFSQAALSIGSSTVWLISEE